MTLKFIAGRVAPVVHDGAATDAVYGVDADGAYLGVVPAASAAAQASRPPPVMGQWRWSGSAWVAYQSIQQRKQVIAAQRDSQVQAGGVVWSGRTWYSDTVFQQQLTNFLTAFATGLYVSGDTAAVRAMDGTIYELTQAELVALFGAVLSYVQALFLSSWQAQGALHP